MNVFLNATAQSQLAQLKAANQVPLNRLDAKKTAVEKQKTSVETVRKEFDQVKTALNALKGTTTAGAAPSAEAVNAFIKEFNELQSVLKAQTAKGAALATNPEARYARSDIRSPFQSLDVLSSARATGFETTRDGLAAAGTPTAALTDAAVIQFEAAFSKVEAQLNNAATRMTTKLDTIADERERASRLVDTANKRTEQNFLKMYQMMQIINSESGSGGSTLFGAF